MRKSITLLAVILTLVLALPALAQEAKQEVAGVVNINTADAAQLALLPGVGPRTAERIVAWRDEHGKFSKVSDLMQVRGIGDKTFERLEPYLTLEGKTTLKSPVASPRQRKSSASKSSNKAPQQ